MLNFACVYYGDKYTFPYVKNLHSMVERNLTVPHRFICFTDNKDIKSNVWEIIHSDAVCKDPVRSAKIFKVKI